MKKVLIALMLLLSIAGYNARAFNQEAVDKAKIYSDNAKGIRSTQTALDERSEFGLTGAEQAAPAYSKSVRFDLKRTDFKGADLRKYCLSSVDFVGADCSGADFSDANLCGADFTDANLTGAKLQRCNASKAKFNNADLSKADVTLANFYKSDFSGAKIDGAKLDRAYFKKVRGELASKEAFPVRYGDELYYVGDKGMIIGYLEVENEKGKLVGRTIKFTYELSKPIGGLKSSIQKQCNIPIAKQHLFLNGQGEGLSDDGNLAQCYVDENGYLGIKIDSMSTVAD
jgi:hypothetical protein